MISPFILFLLPCRPTLLFSLTIFPTFNFIILITKAAPHSANLISKIVMNLMSQINNDDRSRSHFCFVSKQCKLTCRFESENFVDVALFWLNP
ncbi:hypothetical protein ES319_A13G105700v1 [Gossypium barbadense]|uniref:Uncharacterized protein n=2 Tax=Gossypium TaxID=3633 RepID=A0A5J5SXC5_GOSBA|nr:hypothetical protein ES319_A13G105700v1 [Gossypium barbadense]TYG86144.1 hypothetical protein ES288_A13G111700v1 [Gossypium darwinii]